MADFVKNISDTIGTTNTLVVTAAKSISDSISASYILYVDPFIQHITIGSSIETSDQPGFSSKNESLNDSLTLTHSILLTTFDLPIVDDRFVFSDTTSEVSNSNPLSVIDSILVSTSNVSETNFSILSPLTNESFINGHSINFTCSFTKANGSIYNSDIRWISNIDGVIGVGVNSFTYSYLSVGVHTIRLYDINEKEMASVVISVVEDSVPSRPENVDVS